MKNQNFTKKINFSKEIQIFKTLSAARLFVVKRGFTCFIHKKFSAKLHQILLQFLSQSTASNNHCKTQTVRYFTPIKVKPKPVTPAQLKIFKKVPITQRHQINQRERLASKGEPVREGPMGKLKGRSPGVRQYPSICLCEARTRTQRAFLRVHINRYLCYIWSCYLLPNWQIMTIQYNQPGSNSVRSQKIRMSQANWIGVFEVGNKCLVLS